MAETYTIKIGGSTENETFDKVTAHYKKLALQKRLESAPQIEAFGSAGVEVADLSSDVIGLLKKALNR